MKVSVVLWTPASHDGAGSSVELVHVDNWIARDHARRLRARTGDDFEVIEVEVEE